MVPSASASTPWIISSSTSSITPDSVPSAIASFTSSSVTPLRLSVFTRRSASTAAVVISRSHTIGRAIITTTCKGPASVDAIVSGLFNAMRFGTSSPMMSDTYVMATTTAPKAISSP